jgi:superkiller protein 3
MSTATLERDVASLDKAIEFKTNFHEAWDNRGVALLKLGRYEEAITSFKKATEIKSDFHEAWNSQDVALLNFKKLSGKTEK